MIRQFETICAGQEVQHGGDASDNGEDIGQLRCLRREGRSLVQKVEKFFLDYITQVKIQLIKLIPRFF